MEFVTEVWAVLLELAPWLLLGAVVAGLMHGLLPPGFVHRQLRGRSAVPKAVALGVPLPLCSCGVIPAGLGLKKDGASDGASVGFLISTPQTGVDSILVSAAFLGWPFALFKLGAAAATGLAGGWLTDALGGSAGEGHAHEVPTQRPTPAAMFDHGIDLIRSIWGWLLFGVLVSAAITTVVPQSSIAGVAALGTLGATLAVLVFSVPLYVCATASVPIAAALVDAGLPASAALVFLMAGPATNVATLGAVRGAFGMRTTAIYLSTIVAGSVGLGLLFESVIGGGGAHAHAHGDHGTWWATASAVVLLGAIAVFAVQDLQSWLRNRGGVDADAAVELTVTGMTCNGCRGKVERTLLAQPGVEAAEVVLEGGFAKVRGQIDRAALIAAIEDAGFGAT
jgi:uncharacterized membrane protein YraQ (UPF0718 family)/copper chaperone CopZ